MLEDNFSSTILDGEAGTTLNIGHFSSTILDGEAVTTPHVGGYCSGKGRRLFPSLRGGNFPDKSLFEVEQSTGSLGVST